MSQGIHRAPPPDPSAYGNCFGCAPGNMKGMRLQFRHDEAGRILGVEELLGQLRSVDAAAARAAGATLLDGRAAVASVGAQLALAA